MLQQDYLMRMIIRFIEAFTNVMSRHGEERRNPADNKLSRDQLEGAIGDVAEMDPDVLLALEPDSMANILWMGSGSDSTAEYILHALMMDADLYEEDGLADMAALRRDQAQAVANTFGLVYDEGRLDALMNPGVEKEQMEAEEFARQYGLGQ